jgi:hypothetical protein
MSINAGKPNLLAKNESESLRLLNFGEKSNL